MNLISASVKVSLRGQMLWTDGASDARAGPGSGMMDCDSWRWVPVCYAACGTDWKADKTWAMIVRRLRRTPTSVVYRLLAPTQLKEIERSATIRLKGSLPHILERLCKDT